MSVSCRWAQCRTSFRKCWFILANPHSWDVPSFSHCNLSGADALHAESRSRKIFSTRTSWQWKKWPLLPVSSCLSIKVAVLSSLLKYQLHGFLLVKQWEYFPAHLSENGTLGLKSLNNSFHNLGHFDREMVWKCLHKQLIWQIWGVRNTWKRGNKENLGVITSSSATAESRERYQLTDWNCATQKGLRYTANNESMLWCLAHWLSYNSKWNDMLERWYQYDRPLDIFWKGNLSRTLT